MDLYIKTEPVSEEEIFFGKLTLNEVRRHILGNNKSCFTGNNKDIPDDEISNSDCHLVRETPINSAIIALDKYNSELSPATPNLFSEWDVKNTDDSFLKHEKMIIEMSNSPGEDDNKDNINNASQSATIRTIEELQNNTITTSVDINKKTPFKTPVNPNPHKNLAVSSSIKKSFKNSTYSHIASPIASYIKNESSSFTKESRVPKPIIRSSSIPKYVKNTSLVGLGHKDNITLPSPNRSTKKIQGTDKEMLSQSHCVAKNSSVQRPVTMKHTLKENSKPRFIC